MVGGWVTILTQEENYEKSIGYLGSSKWEGRGCCLSNKLLKLLDSWHYVYVYFILENKCF